MQTKLNGPMVNEREEAASFVKDEAKSNDSDNQKKFSGWINVVEKGIDNSGEKDVSEDVQKLINHTEKHSVLYFPPGKYLFNQGITLRDQMTLQGDSYIGANVPRLTAGTTEFICKASANVSVIKLTGEKHCVKNISFYSDSCKRLEDASKPSSGRPAYHHKVGIEKGKENVSAITCDETVEGLGYYENLYISGFSGTGLQLPYYAIANNIVVFTCGLGIDMGIDTILSNSKVWGCKNGMQITSGASISNVRVEEIQEIGVINVGGGSNKITNITIDQCGFCGFQFDTMIESYIIGKITRCGQYYYGTDYAAYKAMSDRKDNAYSLIYGSYLRGCYIQLPNTNLDNWLDGLHEMHQIYVIRAIQTADVILVCNVDAANYVVESSGDLLLHNGKGAHRFLDGKPVAQHEPNAERLDSDSQLKVEQGALYVKQNDACRKWFHPEPGCVIAATYLDAQRIGSEYGGTWTLLDSQPIGERTVYYYEKRNNETIIGS